MKFPLICSLSLVLFSTASLGSDWPHWRGPNRNGTSTETGWNSQWSGEPKVAWKATVGLGFSSIVVSKGRACTAGHAEGQDTVFCFDAVSGNELWKHSYPAELGDKYYEGGTTGTPTFDGDRVYWLSRWGDLFCFEAGTGKIVWSKNIVKETDAKVPQWGFTGAPLVHEKLLVLNAGEAGMAVDKATGAIVWKSANKDDAGYSTPLPIKRGNAWIALLGSEKSYLAVDIASGKEIWRHRWLTQYGVNAADPVVNGDQVFISSGYGKGGALLKLGDRQPVETWKTKALRTQLNPAVLFDGHLYGPDGDTTRTESLKCIEFATGTEKWAEPGFGTGGVIVADGKLIALNAAGELMIAPASPTEFKPIARTQVLGGKCWTAPVLANGIIYCRNSRGEIAAVDVRSK
ncbi:MAG TPA: PQQ-binding-like beta-propeller repeat protein [Chthoniobacteraceae bacterium]|nr:PQQ-binding-like beta-propeller repeat protein [Chthoniobacteraceae bacterium]